MEDSLRLNRMHRRSLASLAALCVVTLVGIHTTAAEQSVTVCDEPTLRAALDQGGTVRFACDGTIYLSQPFVIAKDTILDGSGHNVTLSGSNSVRVLMVQTNVQLTLLSLTVADGRSDKGAGLLNDGGSVVVTGCVFSNNVVLGKTGANGTNNTNVARPPDYSQQNPGGPAEPGGDAAGGAIYNRGRLTLTNTTLTQNQAVGGQGGQGGLGGWIPQYSSHGPSGPSSNGGTGEGAAIFHERGSVRLVDSRVFGNTAIGGLGGTGTTGNAGAQGGQASGGAIRSLASLEILSSAVWSNHAVGGMGGVAGQPAYSVLFPNQPTAGGAGGVGGVGSGGGIYSEGAVSLVNCTVYGNEANGGPGNTGGRRAAGGNGGNASGGGLACVGSGVWITNCTLAADAVRGGVGGAAGEASAAAGTNGVAAGGGLLNSGGQIGLINTVVANSVGGNAAGTITDGGHNLSSDLTGGFTSPTSRNNVDPQLGPLDENGGPTPTVALLSGSPAIDAADPAASPAADQRGVLRPVGSLPDIGAFEGSIPVVTASLEFLPSTITAGGTTILSLTLSSATQTPLAGRVWLPPSLTYAGSPQVTNECGAVASMVGDGTLGFTNLMLGTNQSCTWHFPVASTNAGRFIATARITSPTLDGRAVTSAARLTVTGIPSTTTDFASLDAAGSGAVYGLVNPAGLATQVAFEFGPTESYGNRTAWQSIGSDFDPSLVASRLTNSGTEVPIHYRLVGTNATGLFYGADQTAKPATILTNCDESSLREAIQSGGAFRLTCPGTISLSSPLVISHDTVLEAVGHATVLDGGGTSRLLTVQPGANLALLHLTLANGRADRGGGVYLDGAHGTFVDCVFSNNVAAGTNGLAGASASTNDLNVPGGNGTSGGQGTGGAVFSDHGQIRAQGCIFIGNLARGGDGGIGGDAVASSVFIYPPRVATQGGEGARGGDAVGGGICALEGTTLLVECVAQNNSGSGGHGGRGGTTTARDDGPGYRATAGGNGGSARGGWVFQEGGTLVVRQSSSVASQIVGGNGGRGGDKERGAAGTGGVGGDAEGATLHCSGDTHVSGSWFEGNTAWGGSSGGGGFEAVGWGESTRGTTGGAARGAGVFSTGFALLENSALYGQLAVGGDGGAGADGGAVYNGGAAPGADGGSGGAGLGAGIYNLGGTVMLINLTTDQSRGIGGAGGAGGKPGIAWPSGHPSLPGVPGTQGIASGFALANGTGRLLVINTIIEVSSGGANCVGAITDGGHNLCSDATAGFASLTSANGIDARLQLSSDPTGQPALVPLPDSPAIDAGDDNLCPPTDFRGIPRPIGRASDIGAFEYVPPPTIGVQTNGKTSIRLVRQPRQSFSVEVSTDLADWLPFSTSDSDADGVLQIDDADASNPPKRFYRFSPR